MSAGIWTQIFHTTANPTGTGASGDDRLELVIWKPVLEIHADLLSLEAKDFFRRIGHVNPIENVMQNKEEERLFLFKLLKNLVQNSVSSDLQNLEREFFPGNDAIPLRVISVFHGARLIGSSDRLKRMSTLTQEAVENQYFHLARATEYLYWSQLLHYTIPSTRAFVESKETKIKTLAGDYFITQFYSALASLKSNEIMGLMSEGLTGFCEASFRNSGSKTEFLEHPASILFKNAFKSAAILSGHNEQVQKTAGEFGTTFGETYQTYESLRRNVGRDENVILRSTLCSRLENTIKYIYQVFRDEATSHCFREILHTMKNEVGGKIGAGISIG